MWPGVLPPVPDHSDVALAGMVAGLLAGWVVLRLGRWWLG